MRWTWLLALLALSGCARANADEALLGFGPYQFGDTVAQVRAVDPALEQRESGIDLTVLYGSSPTMIGGVEMHPVLSFRRDGLNRVTLITRGGVQSNEQCTRVYEHVIAEIERRYGALSGGPGLREYGVPTVERASSGGSRFRTYVMHDFEETYANRGGAGWIEATGRVGNHPDAPPGLLGCEIEVDLRQAAPQRLVARTPPTVGEIAAAREIESPPWLETPTSDDFEHTLPSVPQDVQLNIDVRLDCLIIVGGELNCRVADERPANLHFGEFALRLSQRYRIAERLYGENTLGKRVRVPVRLTIGAPPPDPNAPPEIDPAELQALAARAPTSAELEAAETLERPQWQSRPDAEGFSRYYPRSALIRTVSGRAVLDCLVERDGRLRCAIAEEEPIGEGFGLAALGLSQQFATATEIDGRTTVGKRVRVPIRFSVAD